MKISIGLLLFGMSLANATCPDGFYYDENRKLCVNNDDQSITATPLPEMHCNGRGRFRTCSIKD